MKKQKFQSNSYQKHKKEVEGLTQQIEEERAYYVGIIQKKNEEISIFRGELDILLKEVEEAKQDSYEQERLYMENKSNLISR